MEPRTRCWGQYKRRPCSRVKCRLFRNGVPVSLLNAGSSLSADAFLPAVSQEGASGLEIRAVDKLFLRLES